MDEHPEPASQTKSGLLHHILAWHDNWWYFTSRTTRKEMQWDHVRMHQEMQEKELNA